MTNFNPKIRKVTKTSIPAADNSNPLSGMTLAQVIEACQWKLMSGRGKAKAATGETFLNLLTPRLFAASLDETEIFPIPQVYANFDNMEGSVAVALAEYLSAELLKNGEVPDLQYYFKLIDSKTKATIATDMPERETIEVESDLPDFLKPDVVTTATQDNYVPNPSVCAFLHIYAEQDGRPVRIASSDIEARFAPQVSVVSQLVANGNHIQAGVVPQAKVVAWLEEQSSETTSTIDLSSFTAAAEG